MKNIDKKLAQIKKPGWFIEEFQGRQVLRRNCSDGMFVRVQFIETIYTVHRFHADGTAQCGHWEPSWKKMLKYLNEPEEADSEAEPESESTQEHGVACHRG